MAHPAADREQVFAFCDVHLVMTIRRGAAARHALSSAVDGTPNGLRMTRSIRRNRCRHRSCVCAPAPYRPLTAAKDDDAAIRVAGANVSWTGLGMAKHDPSMHRVRDRLPGVSLLGVGPASDLLCGTVPQAPDWFSECGLERAWSPWRRPPLNDPPFAVLPSLALARATIDRQDD